MNKDIIPEDYTLGLALFDAIPVFFFGAACLLLWRMTSSILILIGFMEDFSCNNEKEYMASFYADENRHAFGLCSNNSGSCSRSHNR